jgi:hypothetical protein
MIASASGAPKQRRNVRVGSMLLKNVHNLIVDRDSIPEPRKQVLQQNRSFAADPLPLANVCST